MYNDTTYAPRPPLEVEAIVVLERVGRYNRGECCGPKALLLALAEQLDPSELPHERTIARMLARNGLTHGRLGWSPGEPQYDEPAAMRVCNFIDQLSKPM